MRFLDSAKIYIKAGNGGAGTISFRREKFIEFGGPDGGSGGHGGDVYIKAVGNLNTLIDFRYTQHFKAQNGRKGAGRNRTGQSGDDLIINVPIGTIVFDENKEEILANLIEENQIYKIAQGGIGGKGNLHFKSSTHRSPKIAQDGTEGAELWVWLEMEIIADIGLVGLPNVGKSTLITTITNSKSKVANYSFTTLKPNLGVLSYADKQIIIADLPGLIKGASSGAGLGLRFLSHIKHCKVLLYVIDATTNVELSYNTIVDEITAHDPSILEKEQLIIINKNDLITEQQLEKKITALEKVSDLKIISISALNKYGLDKLIQTIMLLFEDDDKESKSLWHPAQKH